MKKKIPEVNCDEIIPLLIGVWRRFHKLSGPADKLQTREFRSVVGAVQKMQKGLEFDKDYFQDKDLLGAYLLYYWIIHYQQGLSLINELPITPKRVLDICSGPAPMAFAALRHGASDVTAIDRSHAALQLGAEVCGRYGLPLAVRQGDVKSQLPVEGKFDLIMVSHAMEELFPATQKEWQGRQQAFVKGLLNRLTNHGFLLLVESSLNESNRRILMLRDQLVHEGVPVQAPCVWRGECPALKAQNSPCYAQRELEKPYIIKEIQRAAQINQSSLKMTYLIFKSPKAQWPQLPDDRPYYRIISPPVESYQGKRYYLCGTDGKKNLGSHVIDHPADSRAFDYLRRGELISSEGALVKENSLDIVEGTKLKIEAATGKPIPEISQPDEF